MQYQNTTMRGLFDDDYSPFEYPEFVPVFEEEFAPDAIFTQQDQTLYYNAPEDYVVPSNELITLPSQGYTQDETDSGQSSIVPPDFDFGTTITTLLKTITDYDLKRMQIEINQSRMQPGYPLPTLGGKTVKAVRPDPANPGARIVTYTDGTQARVPVSGAGGSVATPILLALGAAGLFFVLRKKGN